MEKFEGLKCPHCGSSKLEECDVIDVTSAEINGEFYQKGFIVGRCQYCGQSLEWYRYYKYMGDSYE